MKLNEIEKGALIVKEKKELTGYPSIDKPWLKYYSEEAVLASAPEATLYEYLYQNNKNSTDCIALNYFGNKITYGKLFCLIEEAARAFAAQGVKAGDVVTFVTLSCIPSVVCLYGLNKIGAVVNYINVLASQKEMESYITDAASRVVVTMDIFAEKVLNATRGISVHRIVVYSFTEYMPMALKVGFAVKMRSIIQNTNKNNLCLSWKEFLVQGKGNRLNHYKKNANTACYLAHTGGTTGVPKSVFLSDRAFNAVTQDYLLSMPHKRGEVFLSTMIPYVVYGTLTNIHMPLCLGLETVLIPKFDSGKWPQYIKKYHPNHCCSIPAYIAPMIENQKLKKMNLTNLFTVGVGGDGMNIPLEKSLNKFLFSVGSAAKVQKGYGMTEVCATAVLEFRHACKIGSVGIPLVKNNVCIWDNEGQRECRYDEVGEICMQCQSVMIGYKNNEAEMEKLFHAHSDGRTWIHTGDIGYMDKDGFLFVQGRMKRMIMTVIDGAVYKIVPAQVEEVINTHEKVHESCVVGAADGKNKVLKVYVVTKENVNVELLEQELRLKCNDRLSENMRPVFYEFIDALPLTPAGKVDYLKLERGDL